MTAAIIVLAVIATATTVGWLVEWVRANTEQDRADRADRDLANERAARRVLVAGNDALIRQLNEAETLICEMAAAHATESKKAERVLTLVLGEGDAS